MKILIDADACPVVDIATREAKKNNIELELYCDTNHVLFSDYVVAGAYNWRSDDFSFASYIDILNNK